jgi:hypothetical protein
MIPTRAAAELAALTLALEETAGRWAKRFPEQGARIVRGLGLAKQGAAQASEEEGVYLVLGSSGDLHEAGRGFCSCDDHRHRGRQGVRCAHRWCLALLAAVEMLPVPAAEASEEEHAAFISWAMGA